MQCPLLTQRISVFSRLIVDDFEKAVSALKTEGFSVTTTQVLAVEINDRPGGLSEAMKALYNDNISVEYMYSAFINTEGKHGLSYP